MEKRPPSSRVVPESAMLHFSFTQQQYMAILAAVQFFSRKLVDPAKREQAISALGALSVPTGFSLPSEVSVAQAAPVMQHEPAQHAARGLATLGGKK